MGEIKEMFEKYLQEGCTEEVAAARVLAHRFTQSPPPGVELETTHYAKLSVIIRERLIMAVPERYRDVIRDLLTHTKTVDYQMICCGAFDVVPPSDEQSGEKYSLFINDHDHAVIVTTPGCRMELIIHEPGWCSEYEVTVKDDGLVVLLSTRDDEDKESTYEYPELAPLPFVPVGIITAKGCFNLAVDRSEGGLRAIQTLLKAVDSKISEEYIDSLLKLLRREGEH